MKLPVKVRQRNRAGSQLQFPVQIKCIVLLSTFLTSSISASTSINFSSSSSSSSRSTKNVNIIHTNAAFGMPAPARLRKLLQSEMDGSRNDPGPILLPCCYDGLSARLIAKAGFEATFMTGFGVSGE
jgi:hypothetical protein